MNLVRDKETGKSRGFAFLKYEDQRSTDLAVDNLGGATVLGRVLKVDHTRYKRKDDEEIADNTEGFSGGKGNGHADSEGKPGSKRRVSSGTESKEEEEEQRPLLKEEKELEALIRDHDEDDPMKEYLVQEKKEKVTRALARLKERERKSKDGSRKHHHRHRSRRRDEGARDEHEERDRRHRRHKDR